ncbi:MAG: hypothetical protein M1819_006620 [Sarea resinae]|nr:MAG: hypothetical protein M1819_006620 [Sarea resinae]
MSPRRSSRARTTQPPSAGSQHTNSSSSSSSSGRAERNTRSHHKAQSPRKASPPLSQASEEAEESAKAGDAAQARRRRREPGSEEDEPPNMNNSKRGHVTEDDEEDEEEITRCICGHQEYPGPLVSLTDASNRRETKVAIRKDGDPNSALTDSEIVPEDAGGLFIQCDICKVWQHGGCVGIMNEAMSPEEYFCEQCRRDLHKINHGTSGPKSSRYLPVLEASTPKPPSRAASYSKDLDNKSSKDTPSRASAAALSTKRRSTMNSRDAAYDEEEQLRRAIEESKGEDNLTSIDGGSKRGKRGRSGSEEAIQDSKRLRTASQTPSPSNHTSHSPSRHDDSQDEGTPTKDQAGKRIRGAAARNQRDKELRDRERERERERADAAGRRKGRAERRRADESDPSDEHSKPAASKAGADTVAQPEDSTPSSQPPSGTSTAMPHPVTQTSHRKTGRPPARRTRVGRNQYTRDRDLAHDLHDRTPNRSQSRDIGGDESNGVHHTNGESGKPSRPRYMNPQRTSMNEMKRRVAGILEFISRMQVEMAGENTPPSAGGGAPNGPTTAMIKSLADTLGPVTNINGGHDASGKHDVEAAEKDFGQLNSLEMMDVLTRKLVLWQKEFGKYGEK